MKDQFDDFVKVLQAFEQHEVEYVLIGGVAMILHGMPRLTQDVDVFIRLTPENIAKLHAALRSLYEDEAIAEITPSELQDYPVIRYGTPQDFYIDIMARLGEVATYETLQSEWIEYEGIKIRLATPEMLFELKRDTLRDKDKIDAAFLAELIKERQDEKKRKQ
jgi:predicted nucleotidyltransferase